MILSTNCRTFACKTFICLFSLITAQATAQNWTGNVNSDWNNSANWTGWPLTGDDLLIDPANYTGAAAAPVITANSVFTPDGLVLQNGAQLTIQANLTTNDRIELFGAGTVLTISAGTLNANGSGSRGRFIVSEDAHVTMNGGTLTAAQRIIIDLGGSLTLNNGTVHPLEELAIGDGSLTASSLFKMNGGAVIVGQSIGFENEAGTFYPTFDMSGGTLTVNNDITWLGESPGAGAGQFIMSGGTGSIGGNIFNDPASTIDLLMDLSGNAQLAFNGATITQVRSTDSILQSGTSLFTFSNTNTWNNNGVFNGGTATAIFNGNTNLQGAGAYTFNNISINTSCTLSHISPANISITGDLLNNGTFNPNTNTLTFSGTNPQNAGGSSITSFYNFTLNNSSASGLTLYNPIKINAALQLNNGRLNSSATNLVTLADNATASAGSAASFVNGPLKKTGNDAFVFPVGKNNKWRRLAISAPASALSEFTAEYTDSTYSSISPVTTPLNAVSNIEYWTLNRQNSTDGVQLSLYWEDATASAISNCSELSIARWNGSAWENNISVASGSCTGSGNGLIQSTAALSDLDVFTFGFYGNVTTQNLAICSGDSVIVGNNTYTTSGTYIDQLTTAEMTDSTVITHLYVIPVNVSVLESGSTLTAVNMIADTYQWLDCNNNYSPLTAEISPVFNAATNGNYAVQITQSGCVDTSACYAVFSVGLTQNAKNNFSVFPNPGNGKVTINTGGKTNILLRLSDNIGRTVAEMQASGPNAELDFSDRPAGIYILQIREKDTVSQVKLIKQ